MTDSAEQQQSQSRVARAVEFDVPPPAGIAALAGREGWDAMMATVTDSVKARIRRLDRSDLLDLDAGRRREEILARLRRETVADGARSIVDTSPDGPGC